MHNHPGPPLRLAPRSVRLRVMAALLVIVFAAGFTGGRCYKPETRVVVFIQGLYTTYDGETQSTAVEGPRFTTLKDGLRAAGYKNAMLLDFSYAGGTVGDDGSWMPTPYTCELTDRRADETLGILEGMLRDYRSEHEGTHFALVGHSLGGYLAYLEGAREADRPDGEKLDIDVVVTLDAPLQGVNADKKAIIDNIPCDKTYIAGAEIVAAKLDPGLAETRAAETAKLAAEGIRLATLGNLNDCLWNTDHCLPGAGFIDDSETQFLLGATAKFRYEFASSPLASHDAILAYPPAVTDAVAFIDKP